MVTVKKILFRLACALPVLLLLLSAPAFCARAEADVAPLEVTFLDVGQGDCALLRCGNTAILIDGGPADASETVYSFLVNTMEISHLDCMIATHPHNDHVGGLSAALKVCDVGVLYCPWPQYDSRAFSSMLRYAEEQGTAVRQPEIGDVVTFGDLECTFLAPVSPQEDLNEGSAVVRVDHGDIAFLFTGDIGRETEDELLLAEAPLRADVLKVAHHGSSGSTSEAFLREVSPQIAVISVGENNDYGHPSARTLDLLEESGVTILRTDRMGDITCLSDGSAVTWQCEISVRRHLLDAIAPYVGNFGSGTLHLASCENAAEIAPANRVPFFSPDSALRLGYRYAGCCMGDYTLPQTDGESEDHPYVGNSSRGKFHSSQCGNAAKISQGNRVFFDDRETAIAQGYEPAGCCAP